MRADGGRLSVGVGGRREGGVAKKEGQDERGKGGVLSGGWRWGKEGGWAPDIQKHVSLTRSSVQQYGRGVKA